MQRRTVINVRSTMYMWSCYVQENVNTFYRERKDAAPYLSHSLLVFICSPSSRSQIGTRFSILRTRTKKNVYIEIKLEHFFGHFTSFHTFLSLSSLLHCKRKLLTVRISQNIFEHLDKANSILSCFVLIFCSVILIRQNAWFNTRKYWNWADF